jgi:hypothetical protein
MSGRPMPRVKREGWKPMTLTLHPEAAARLRVHAAIKETDMGVLVSELILNRLGPVLVEEPLIGHPGDVRKF